MVSLVIYLMSFVIIIGILGSITVFFGSQTNDINMSSGASSEYNKFNLYMLKQTKNSIDFKINNETEKNQYVTFSDGKSSNTFLQKGNLLYFNKIKLCENVDDFKLETTIAQNGKKVLKTYLQINGTVYTTDYVIE